MVVVLCLGRVLLPGALSNVLSGVLAARFSNDARSSNCPVCIWVSD